MGVSSEALFYGVSVALMSAAEKQQKLQDAEREIVDSDGWMAEAEVKHPENRISH